jgi:hypothetical protein
MKNIIIVVILAATGYYYFSNRHSPCETMDDVKDKAYALSKAFIHAATANNNRIDPVKLMEKIKEVEVMKTNGFPDRQQACQLMDELMDELD